MIREEQLVIERRVSAEDVLIQILNDVTVCLDASVGEVGAAMLDKCDQFNELGLFHFYL